MERLQLGRLDENNLEELISNIASFMNHVVTKKDDVYLSLSNHGYISPALAIALHAAKDLLKKENKTVYFPKNELAENEEVKQFMVDSGLLNSTSELIRNTVTNYGQNRVSRAGNEFQIDAHHIDLVELRSEDESQAMHELYFEASSAAAAINVDKTVVDASTIISHLIELLDNAVEHSQSGFAYTMCVNTRHDNTLMVVYDSGIGIPAAYNDYRIKNDFPQLSDVEAIVWAAKDGNSTKQLINGVPRGAGLSSMRRFAMRYHGRIAIASGTGGCCYDEQEKTWSMNVPLPGTLFIMTIPNKKE